MSAFWIAEPFDIIKDISTQIVASAISPAAPSFLVRMNPLMQYEPETVEIMLCSTTMKLNSKFLDEYVKFIGVFR